MSQVVATDCVASPEAVKSSGRDMGKVQLSMGSFLQFLNAIESGLGYSCGGHVEFELGSQEGKEWKNEGLGGPSRQRRGSLSITGHMLGRSHALVQ